MPDRDEDKFSFLATELRSRVVVEEEYALLYLRGLNLIRNMLGSSVIFFMCQLKMSEEIHTFSIFFFSFTLYHKVGGSKGLSQAEPGPLYLQGQQKLLKPI